MQGSPFGKSSFRIKRNRQMDKEKKDQNSTVNETKKRKRKKKRNQRKTERTKPNMCAVE